MSILTEITSLLAGSSIGLSSGTNLFYGPMHEEYPDAVVLVNLYGGLRDEPNLGEGALAGKATRLEFKRVQILARGAPNDTDGPLALAKSCHDVLVAVLDQTLSGTYYLEVAAVQPPFRMPTDKNFRETYIFNVQCTKEPS